VLAACAYSFPSAEKSTENVRVNPQLSAGESIPGAITSVPPEGLH